jgi:DNA polymerase-3 subunit delta'
MKWNEVIGQEEVADRLKAMVCSGRMPHALMLCGNTGHGALALAMALASTLICQNSNGRKKAATTTSLGMFGEEEDSNSAASQCGDPCGVCPQCAMLKQWHHPDLHFSFPTVKLPSMSTEHKPVSDDFISNWNELINREGPYISLEQWMEQMGATTQQAIITAGESDALTRKTAIKSSQGGYKVGIIWLAELMNESSANKFLKTLEEPSDDTIFILVVERPELLLETIRSRVQRIDIPRISQEALQAALTEQQGIDSSMALKIARAAEGNWNNAVEMLKPESEQKMFLDLFIMIMRQAYTSDVRGMKKWSDTVAAFGREQQKRMLQYFMRMVREAFISNFKEPALSYMTVEEEEFIKKFGQFVNEINIIEINELLELALRDISQNTYQKVVFFDTALRLTVLIQRNKRAIKK